MDKHIIGFWRICDIDMVEDKAVKLLGGLPGEIVEFTSAGRYVLWGDPRRPARYRCRTFTRKGLAALDVWIERLEPLTVHSIYRVDGSGMLVCVGGDSGARPTAFRRDDRCLWCLVSFERCEPPPKCRPAKPRKLLEPGKFIPKGFFSVGRAKRRK